MRTKFTRMDVEAAKEDIRNHTLAPIKNDFGRLIYLASTRDYNTGKYYHDGLAFQFSEPTAERALAACHHEVFEQLLECPLEDFVCQLRVTCVPHTPTPVRPRMSGRSCKRTGPPYPCAVARWRRGCLFPMSRSL